MSSYTRQQLELWLKTIDVKTDRVIDVGGAQNSVKDRTKSWDVKDYKILDLEISHECKHKQDICWDMNYDNFASIEYKEHFDIAFCLEVSEYWWNPSQALKNIYNILKQHGILYISFHFIYPVHNPTDQDYLRYTPRGVEKLLEEAGFMIEEIKPRLTEDNALMTFWQCEGMRFAKEYDKHSWVGSLLKATKT